MHPQGLFKSFCRIFKSFGRGKKNSEDKNTKPEEFNRANDIVSSENEKKTEECKTGFSVQTNQAKPLPAIALQIPIDKRIGAWGKAHGIGTQDAFYFTDKIIAVSDGVGESIGSEIASEFVTKMFVDECTNLQNVNFKSVNEVWNKLGEKLKVLYIERYEKTGAVDFKRVLTGFLATTLLSVIELDDSYMVSYLGNGSIWYVRGDFWEFLESKRKWPWCVEDILIPHSTYIGEEALFGILDYTGIKGTPSIINVQKDFNMGEIFILTTDGVSSKDKLRIFGQNGGRVYEEPSSQEINSNIFKILLSIKNYLYNFETNNTSINDLIKNFLDNNKFDDDATLAILISEKAIQYFNKKKTVSKEKE